MKNFTTILFFILILASCAEKNERGSFNVTNSLDIERKSEVVSVPRAWVEMNEGEKLEEFGILSERGNLQLVQYVDENKDGIKDAILFRPKISAKMQSKYVIKKLNQREENPSSDNECFSRFVPERTDDYAWENDRVAFRMFGPAAQKMKEDGTPGGTLTSGIDCWLKRVEHPIINKWYKDFESDPNAYHTDSGEGLDNFHVGISRGCGGIAVKSNGEYYTSKNFTSYNTLTNGFIQTAFELDYAPWSAGDSLEVKTSNRISLDRGSQLSKVEVSVEGTNVISAGLTLHENDGMVTVDSLGGWMSYWQPHGDTYLGMAIIAAPGTYLGYEKVESEEADKSHAYMSLAVKDGKAVYYSGFFWLKSGQFKGQKEWEKYLSVFSAQLVSPLEVSKD